MANQPVKRKFDYERYFSNELQSLLSYIETKVAEEIPFKTLTFDVFLVSALETKDCMLYRALNGFLTSSSIDKLHDTIYETITKGDLAPIRPGRALEYSPEMINLFTQSQAIMDEIKSKTITSDIILLAFIRSAPKTNQIRKAIVDAGISEDTALELIKKMRDVVSSISDMTPEQFDNFADKLAGANVDIRMDLGNGESVSSVSIIDMNGLSSLNELVNQMMGGTKQKKDKSSSVDYCESLNVKAERGEIEKLIGREKEIFEITKVLNRKVCNNVVLVGETGVGKTAIVEGLAKQIVDGNAPMAIRSCEIFKLNIPEIIAGTQFRGQLEQRAMGLIKSLKKLPNPILFIDNIHSYMNEKKNVEFDIFGELEPVFSDKDVMVIIATTPKGFHGSFENSTDTMRRFQRVTVESPTVKECKEILEGVRGSYEKFHKVKYDEGMIDAAISLANRYITDRKLPSSAIDILDEAGAIKKLEIIEPEIVYKKRGYIAELNEKRKELIAQDKIDEAKEIENELEVANITLSKLIDDTRKAGMPTVTLDEIYRAVSEHTGIPVAKINVSEKQVLSRIDAILKRDIIGQDEAINIVTRGIKRNKVGLGQPNRPILSCLCLGSTGCGKTLLAKTLAKEIFGDEKYLVRFDMSEYADKTAVNKLIGASAGYVGYTEGGLLTEAIKNKRHAVLLIDEIEKATDEIFNLFLQVLDEGFLTDNTGVRVDFKNVILILTSNVGAKRAATEHPIGFSADNDANKRDVIEKELKNRFQPEFLNRLDEIVYFNTLTDENLKEIVRLELGKLMKKIMDAGYSVNFTGDIIDYIYDKILPEKEYGARPISRMIQREIENPITDYILENECEGKSFSISISDGKVKIE